MREPVGCKTTLDETEQWQTEARNVQDPRDLLACEASAVFWIRPLAYCRDSLRDVTETGPVFTNLIGTYVPGPVTQELKGIKAFG